jgi:hypothetical protein
MFQNSSTTSFSLPMRGYFFRVIAIAAACLAIHFFVCLYMPSPIAAEYWVREMIVVKRALAVSSPRIVVLGGSSSLFGIDARQVTAETGVFTMNMGLHVGVRIDRLLAVGEEMAQRGDIFVLALESLYYDCAATHWTDWQIRNMLAWDRAYFDDLPFRSRLIGVFTAGGPQLSINIFAERISLGLLPQRYADRLGALKPDDVILARYRSGRSRTDHFSYSAYNLDDHGDMLNNRGATFSGAGIPATSPGPVCPAIVAILANFVASMKAKGVRVVAAHTPYLVDGAPAPGWQKAEHAFLRDLTAIGLEVVDHREELFFSRSSFFNTSQHLNESGRRERTKLLINDLRRFGIGIPAINDRPSPPSDIK